MTLLGLRSSKAPGREFRQHDGMVTILMFYYRRASPKRCNNTTEVEYGGGGHRTRLRNDLKDQLVCHGVPLAPVYKGARGRGGRPRRRRAKGSTTPTGSRTPSFLVGVGEGGKKGRGGRKGGPHPLSNSDQRGAARLLPFHLFPLFPYGPIRPNTLPRISVTHRYLQKYPNHSEPFRCPNIVVQYTDLYVSTISRLLVMSPISSGTPNSFGTSKLINSLYNCHRNLKRADPTVREQCRHDRDTSPVNNQ